MGIGRERSYGDSANEAVGSWASRVDDQTGAVARRATGVIVMAVRLLRIPTAAVLFLSVPFIVAFALLAINGEGAARVVASVIALAMAAVAFAFGARRQRILRAVAEPEVLATELGIMVSMSDKVGETRGALAELAGGGGWRVFSRLGGAWRGVGMTGRWIDEIGDLPRARYFAPPKIGTTITITIAALWLVPISMIATLVAIIATLAGTL